MQENKRLEECEHGFPWEKLDGNLNHENPIGWDFATKCRHHDVIDDQQNAFFALRRATYKAMALRF